MNGNPACKDRIAIFAREPVLGKVKTRLQRELGEQACLALYKRMMLRSIQTSAQVEGLGLQLWVHGSTSSEFILALEEQCSIHSQGDGDLGRKMHHTMEQNIVTEGCESLLIIGTDCPVLDKAYLQSAMNILQQERDVVIGPAEDGGYVLIGMNKFVPEVFVDIEWGTERVLEQTLEKLDEAKRSYTLLDVLWDVDRPEDLRRLQELEVPL